MRFILIIFFVALLSFSSVSAQQSAAACGVVDVLDYPIDGLVPGYDDFAFYRARFSGNHTGIDIGFDRWGDPVRASARGRVTYADPAGWNTEKGVVIIQHAFPDGNLYYTLYGHMEESDSISFPPVGQCVDRGTVIGTIGWPSLGRPHLHYEIRNFLPNDGGPGYVVDNPLDHGWFDALDFTAVWRARLAPGYINSVMFETVPSLPPVLMDSGNYAFASADTVLEVTPAGQVLWRIKTDSEVTGVIGLPGDRVIARTTSGQVLSLQGGRYLGIWAVQATDQPFVALGEALVFPTSDGGLVAYDSLGAALWTLAGVSGETLTNLTAANGQAGFALQTPDGMRWRTIDSAGQVVGEVALTTAPIAAPLPDGSWQILDGKTLLRVQGAQSQTLASDLEVPGEGTALTVDVLGNTYLYVEQPPTLLALTPSGTIRWQVDHEQPEGSAPPLIAAGQSCLLYVLDGNGLLTTFNASDGTALNQTQLYAGGRRNGSPNARMLQVNTAEQVQVASGFLSMLTFDGRVLAGNSTLSCS